MPYAPVQHEFDECMACRDDTRMIEKNDAERFGPPSSIMCGEYSFPPFCNYYRKLMGFIVFFTSFLTSFLHMVEIAWDILIIQVFVRFQNLCFKTNRSLEMMARHSRIIESVMLEECTILRSFESSISTILPFFLFEGSINTYVPTVMFRLFFGPKKRLSVFLA